MHRRSLLRSHLMKAWRKTIEREYNSQLINSEHGLQVYFCAELLRLFKKSRVNRRIFVEPRVSSRAGKHRHPDIVICNTKYIIGVVELKYVPRSRPGWKKDIDTLKFIASNPAGLEIANERYLGIEPLSRPYPLAPDAVLCWGAVYTGKPFDLTDKVVASLGDRFLQLHAVTANGERPDIIPRR